MNRLFRIVFFLPFIFIQIAGFSQVNAYAHVTSIAGNTINVSNVNETFDTFEDGEYIVIMQMQDDVIGANTGQNNSFGNLSAISNCGKYEVRYISSHTEAALVPTSITITPALGNVYNTGANSCVQIISFPILGAPNYTTAANITPVNWSSANGCGGVVAFWVNGILTLANNITANGAGFAGGSRSANYYPGGTTCDTVAASWYTGSSNRGEKGEGIYLRTNAGYRYGKAHILSGGGGGVNINSGGGGGGNYSAGGAGGPGWNNTAGGCPAGAQGLGGISLSGSISQSRIFMGGGGGGGQQNDGVGTSGGNGGGIILIRANQIITAGACGGRTISANGTTAGNPGNDGAGGGGAGGSIVFEVGSWNIVGTCLLTISANGGNGGGVTNAATHGGGGGGGQGVVIFSGAQPVTNVTTSTNAGSGGVNNSGGSSSASSGGGPNNSGIFTGTSTPLPINLYAFNAFLDNSVVQTTWTTASETNNAYFTVERSADGVMFYAISDHIPGAGTSSSYHYYSFTDESPLTGLSYYRLKQTDFDGHSTYSYIVPVDRGTEGNGFEFILYPNPSDGTDLNVELSGSDEEVLVVLYDALGNTAYSKVIFTSSSGSNVFALDPSGSLAPGVYMVTASSNDKVCNKKLIIR